MIDTLASAEVSPSPGLVRALENWHVRRFAHRYLMTTFVIEQEEPCEGDSQARFRENLRVQLLWVTRLVANHF